MKSQTFIIWVALSLMVVPSVMAATSVEKVRNPKVLVTEETLAPGQAESLANHRPDIIVYLAGNEAAIVNAQGVMRKQSVKRGTTVFEPAGTRSIRNAGSTALRFVRVQFLTAGQDVTWGMSGLPASYKILVENRYTRTYEIKIPAPSYGPRHTQHARVVIVLSGAQLQEIKPDGQRKPSTLKTGEIVWHAASTQVGRNIGNTNLWDIIVEPK